MAGLVVGAIDLSIWVSVSQATNPEEINIILFIWKLIQI